MLSPKELLAASVGEWVGTYKLWLEPGVLRGESPARGTIRPLLGGRFIAHDYEWSDDGVAQLGMMLFGCNDEGVCEMSWVDTWHNGDSIMFCTGGPQATVLGRYGPADEPWGWRTEFAMPAPDQLLITAWNINPQGDEDKATETRYTRAT